jgi:hypothetical protein
MLAWVDHNTLVSLSMYLDKISNVSVDAASVRVIGWAPPLLFAFQATFSGHDILYH